MPRGLVFGVIIISLVCSVAISSFHTVYADGSQQSDSQLSPEEYFQEGMIALSSGDYWPAIENFSLALIGNPDYANAYHYRGDAYYYLGYFQQAIENYTLAVVLNPADAVAYYNQGNAYSNLGRHFEAIQSHTLAIAIDAEYILAYFERGNAYRFVGQNERAIENYTSAIDLGVTASTDTSSAYRLSFYNRGLAYLSIRNYPAAISDFTITLKLDPCSPEAFQQLAIAYAGQSNVFGIVKTEVVLNIITTTCFIR